MATRKKHLINVHTGTGTTAPTNASLYLGEIAVQHTPENPALWIKMGTAESSTEYEKFIGETAIMSMSGVVEDDYLLKKAYVASGTTAGRWSVEIPHIDEYYDGLTIMVRLGSSYNGTSNLLNVNGLGNRFVFFRKSSIATSHFPQWAEVRLVYREDASTGYTSSINYGTDIVSGTVYTAGWVADYAYYSDSDYRTLAYYEKRYAGDRLTRYQIIGIGEDERLYPLTRVDSGDYNTGTTKPVNTVGFRPERFFYRSTIGVVNTGGVEAGQVDYEYVYITTPIYTFNSTLSAYRAIYLRGTYDESKNLFYLNTGLTTFYTQVPTNTANITLSDYFVEGDYYISLGTTYSSNNYFQLNMSHELFYFDGTNLVKAWSNKILGPSYTYSGIPYVNSATTLADAYSALTSEVIDNEEVTAEALNDLNDRANDLNNRVIEISGNVANIHVDMILGSGYTYSGLPYVNSATTIADAYSATTKMLIDDERVIAEAFNQQNDRILAMSGDINTINEKIDNIHVDMILGSGYTYSGIPYVNSATTIADAYSALTNEVILDELVFASAVNDLNDRVDTKIETTVGDSGMLPNVVYELGTVGGSVSFELAPPTKTSIVNHYYWTFDTGTLTPTVTWPSGISKWAGNCVQNGSPVLVANAHYEVSIMDGYAFIVGV